jgi:hypothetical protein
MQFSIGIFSELSGEPNKLLDYPFVTKRFSLTPVFLDRFNLQPDLLCHCGNRDGIPPDGRPDLEWSRMRIVDPNETKAEAEMPMKSSGKHLL